MKVQNQSAGLFFHFSFKTSPRRKHRHKRLRGSGAKLEPRPLSYESGLTRKNWLATRLLFLSHVLLSLIIIIHVTTQKYKFEFFNSFFLYNFYLIFCCCFFVQLLCSLSGWLHLNCTSVGTGFNGAETNCGIAHNLGILLMNSNCGSWNLRLNDGWIYYPQGYGSWKHAWHNKLFTLLRLNYIETVGRKDTS